MDSFVRIQKSGSTSLRHSLSNNDKVSVLDHSYCYNVTYFDFNIDEIKLEKKTFRNFELNQYDNIYAVIRNPFDILISYYHHQHGAVGFNEGWSFCNTIHNVKSWREFLDYYIDPNKPWHLPPMKRSMFSFARNGYGNLIIDDYFKIEESSKLENYVRSVGGTSLGMMNKTAKRPKKDTREFYTDSDIKSLSKIWERDLDEFKYTI